MRVFILIGLLMFFITGLHARGSREEPPAPAPDAGNSVQDSRLVQITGVVRLVGSSHFSDLVITTQEGDYYIASDDRYLLHDLQQRTVTVEGDETLSEMRFAGGQSAGTRRQLRNVRIIEVR